jgi:RNA polymerase sigma factor (sigma-70 family)
MTDTQLLTRPDPDRALDGDDAMSSDPLRPLARRLAAGREGAFAELVDTLSSPVFSSVLRLTGNRPDAEDITQETFIRAYRALARYPTDQVAELRLRPWLWTIALNLCRNRERGRGRRPATTTLTDDHHPADPGSTEAEELDLVDDAWQRRLGALADHVRTAVLLRHVAGLGYGEIAAVVDRPVGTVKSDVHRGIGRLRQMIEQETETEEPR